MGPTVCEMLPCDVINLITQIIRLIKIGVPILIIIFGMLDLGKSIVSSNAEDIAKHRKTFTKRLFTGALVFFVGVVTELMLTIVQPGDEELSCVKQILRNEVKTCQTEIARAN